MAILSNELQKIGHLQDGKFEKISSQMKSLQAEFKMHFPDELSKFLSDKPKPKEICDIESDEN